jgi:hypothetical protein
MPITENGSIEYTMPQDIKAMITPEFCAQIAKELHIIFGVGITDTDYDCLVYQGGTSGWNVAISSSCRKLGLDELCQYYHSLPWYDSDIFDGELSDILIENKWFVPKSDAAEIARQYGIAEDNVKYCDKCNKLFHIDDVEVCAEPEDEYDESIYACKSCLGKCESTALIWDKQRTLREVLKRSNDQWFVCEKCGNIHAIEHRGEKYCLHCEQPTSSERSANANDYYLSELHAQREYVDRLKSKRSKN